MPLSIRWPHHPTRMSDLIDPETLAVLISGSCARLGRALTVLDYDKGAGAIARIDPLLPWQNFAAFCQLLRNETRVRGGNAACEACDQERARSVAINGDDRACGAAAGYRCHMGLTDFSQVICVDELPVAVLLAGQFAAPQKKDEVRHLVQRIAKGARSEIQLLDDGVEGELLQRVDQIDPPSPDFAARFSREAERLQTMAAAHYHRQKVEYENEFLDKLRKARRFADVTTLQEISGEAGRLLRMVQEHCGIRYIVLFCSVGERDTVLTPLAQVGFQIETGAEALELPHFNWTKSGLSKIDDAEGYWYIDRKEPAFARGVRGDHTSSLNSAACALALMLGNGHRMVVLFGPFAELTDPRKESEFLFNLSRIIGWGVYAQVQALRLREERERAQATTMLLQHRLKTALTPIATHIGRAKLQLEKRHYDTSLRTVVEQIKAAHDLSLQLGRAARETARSAVVMVERDDLKFAMYPLSVLVANCAEGFVRQAEARARELSIEATIEQLPYAEVDIARLTIAISNLLDNAVKYSFPTTRIQVLAVPPNATDRHHATILVQDMGDPIPPDKMALIFERGKRGLAEVKMGRIPGTGYGLWEARAIVEAHGGSLEVKCTETNFHLRQGRAYRVNFAVRIPLRQKNLAT
ncbi:ATP-binding protein [Caldilinea sp.]|uniref:ATP-binding protein n=1 Tax=Caldilinea sp. TaxID=2293560 RepID=UPI002C19BE72|nr:ATP-binding protein [Caldilinea sp.]